MATRQRSSIVIVRPGGTNGRIRVTPLTAADRRWQELGRSHFLNRAAFERHVAAGRSLPARLMSTRTLTVAPFLDLLVVAALFFLPLWAIWKVTQWTCPPAGAILLWAGRKARSAVRQLTRTVWRWAYRTLWRGPVERYGLAVTVWLYLAVLVVLSAMAALLTGNLIELVALVPLAAVVIGWWHLLRWWRTRLYRPRPLPGRRPRDRHG